MALSLIRGWQDTAAKTKTAIEPPAAQQPRHFFTAQEITEQIRSQGFNPDNYDIDAMVAGQTPKGSAVPAPNEAKAPHYMITVQTGATQMVYGSDDEPKPYGNGYKFKAIGYGKEVIVSGDVQIVKLW